MFEAPVESIGRLRVVVYGRVQGVGFRYFAQREATALRLSGYARNNSDGTVEVVAEGLRSDLERLLCRLRAGPRSANVLDVAVEWQPASDRYRSFGIRL